MGVKLWNLTNNEWVNSLPLIGDPYTLNNFDPFTLESLGFDGSSIIHQGQNYWRTTSHYPRKRFLTNGTNLRWSSSGADGTPFYLAQLREARELDDGLNNVVTVKNAYSLDSFEREFFVTSLENSGFDTTKMMGDYQAAKNEPGWNKNEWTPSNMAGWNFIDKQGNRSENTFLPTGTTVPNDPENRYANRKAFWAGLPRHSTVTYKEGQNAIQDTGKPWIVTLGMGEFSYNNRGYLLPYSFPSPVSHQLVYNFTSKFCWTLDDYVNQYAVPGTSVWADSEDVPEPGIMISAETLEFGVRLQRNSISGHLELTLNAPAFPELVDEVGLHILGDAITHTPPEADETPGDDYKYLFSALWRRKVGYVLQCAFNEDRTKFTVIFNGTQLFKAITLPAELTTYLTEKQDLIIPTLAAGMNFLTREAYSSYFPFYYKNGNGPAVMSFQFSTFTDQLPFPDILGPRGDIGYPFYMNRPDGLNSAPPWANLGSGWRGINRSALWQRNNAR